jgi:tRNA 2-thiouridine synthesizing protein A
VSEEESSIVRLDTRGLRCPLPVQRTRRRLEAVPPGTVIEVLSDDPLVVLDMQAFCAKEGNDYLGHEPEGPAFRLKIRKRT